MQTCRNHPRRPGTFRHERVIAGPASHLDDAAPTETQQVDEQGALELEIGDRLAGQRPGVIRQKLDRVMPVDVGKGLIASAQRGFVSDGRHPVISLVAENQHMRCALGGEILR